MSSIVKPQVPVINWSNPLTRNLVVDLPFFEGGNTNPVDLVTRKKTTAVNTPTWSVGKFGKALNPDVAGDGVFQTTDARLRVSQINSFECLIYIRNFPPVGQDYLGNIYGDDDDSTSTSALWRIGSQGLDTLNKRFGINFRPDPSTDTDQENDNDLPQNQWVHVVVVTNGTTITWYVDGVLDTQKAYTITPQANTLNWYVARFNSAASNTRWFDGLVSYIRRWDNRALTAREVTTLYLDPWVLYRPHYAPVFRR